MVNQELDAERRVHSDLTSGMVDLVGELKKTTLDMNQMVRTQNIVSSPSLHIDRVFENVDVISVVFNSNSMK